MKERFFNLLSIKSIVTLLLTAVVAVLAVKQIISSQEVMTIYTMIIGFYFGTQHEKKSQ